MTFNTQSIQTTMNRLSGGGGGGGGRGVPLQSELGYGQSKFTHEQSHNIVTFPIDPQGSEVVQGSSLKINNH